MSRARGSPPTSPPRSRPSSADSGSSITILIVAHDMDLVFGLADTILVLHYGQVLCTGEAGGDSV